MTTVRVQLPAGIFPDRPTTLIPVPRAWNLDDVVIEWRECRCGCRFIFLPCVAWQFFFDDNHRRRYESKHRRPWCRKKDEPRERECRCGCGLVFMVPAGSTQVYVD